MAWHIFLSVNPLCFGFFFLNKSGSTFYMFIKHPSIPYWSSGKQHAGNIIAYNVCLQQACSSSCFLPLLLQSEKNSVLKNSAVSDIMKLLPVITLTWYQFILGITRNSIPRVVWRRFQVFRRSVVTLMSLSPWTSTSKN